MEKVNKKNWHTIVNLRKRSEKKTKYYNKQLIFLKQEIKLFSIV